MSLQSILEKKAQRHVDNILKKEESAALYEQLWTRYMGKSLDVLKKEVKELKGKIVEGKEYSKKTLVKFIVEKKMNESDVSDYDIVSVGYIVDELKYDLSKAPKKSQLVAAMNAITTDIDKLKQQKINYEKYLKDINNQKDTNYTEEQRQIVIKWVTALVNVINEVIKNKLYKNESKTILESIKTMYDVWAKRNGERSRWNKSPMTADEADSMMNSIKKIPSVDINSIKKVVHDGKILESTEMKNEAYTLPSRKQEKEDAEWEKEKNIDKYVKHYNEFEKEFEPTWNIGDEVENGAGKIGTIYKMEKDPNSGQPFYWLEIDGDEDEEAWMGKDLQGTSWMNEAKTVRPPYDEADVLHKIEHTLYDGSRRWEWTNVESEGPDVVRFDIGVRSCWVYLKNGDVENAGIPKNIVKQIKNIISYAKTGHMYLGESLTDDEYTSASYKSKYPEGDEDYLTAAKYNLPNINNAKGVPDKKMVAKIRDLANGGRDAKSIATETGIDERIVQRVSDYFSKPENTINEAKADSDKRLLRAKTKIEKALSKLSSHDLEIKRMPKTSDTIQIKVKSGKQKEVSDLVKRVFPDLSTDGIKIKVLKEAKEEGPERTDQKEFADVEELYQKLLGADYESARAAKTELDKKTIEGAGGNKEEQTKIIDSKTKDVQKSKPITESF